jgi:plasmid stabilization system protein ParE
MNIQYTATVRAEIDGILAYIAGDNPPAATAVSAAIDTAISRLRTFPRMGTSTDVEDVYMKIARPYRYLIFYSVIENTIIVRNVRHPARQHPPR